MQRIVWWRYAVRLSCRFTQLMELIT